MATRYLKQQLSEQDYVDKRVLNPVSVKCLTDREVDYRRLQQQQL